MEIKKTKNIPFDKMETVGYKYPFRDMEVDDYFEIERPVGEEFLERPKKYYTLMRIQSSITMYKRSEDGKNKIFIVRNEQGPMQENITKSTPKHELQKWWVRCYRIQ